MGPKLSVRQRVALELARKIHANNCKLHPLKQLFWECTRRCNINCMHCGSDCTSSTTIPDMPAEDFLRAIDSITPHVNPHEVSIIITGGEPLVRKDLETVGLELYRRGYPWGIVSNGLALTPERWESLRRAGIHAITISIDGLEEHHNRFRGHPLSHARAMSAIRMISEAEDINRDVVTCVNRDNYPTLREIRAMLEEAGVRRWRLFTIFPMGRAAGHKEFTLIPEEYNGLMEFIIETREKTPVKASYCCEGFLGGYEGKVRDRFFNCSAGINIGSILIDGSIGACLSIRSNFHQGNIYKDDFMDVWNNRFKEFRDREWMRTGECADCKMFRYCNGNGMHLRDNDRNLLRCNLKSL